MVNVRMVKTETLTLCKIFKFNKGKVPLKPSVKNIHCKFSFIMALKVIMTHLQNILGS